MNPLRIVLVFPDPPLPHGTAAGRWFYVLLKGLVERGHDITAFAACDHERDAETARHFLSSSLYDLRCYPRALDAGPMGKWRTLQRPYSYLFSVEFRTALARELSSQFDVLHLEQLWTGWLGLPYAQRSLLNVHYLFSVDLAGVSCNSAVERLRRLSARRGEIRLLRSYPSILTLTPQLADRVSRIAPRAEISAIPLALDLSQYPFASEERRVDSRPTVGLIGSFDWPATYLAGVRLLRELWPAIKQQVPTARLLVVGRRARAAMGHIAGGGDVEIYEDVPDTRPYFAAVDVLLYAPPFGSGIKVKVLEAFAMGTPVVTTPAGIEGISALDGAQAGVCETNAGLVQRAISLLNDTGLRQRQRQCARKLVETRFSPSVVLDRLEEVYARLSRIKAGAA